MGHRKKHAPKRGSLAYSPRKRAKRQSGRIRYWPPYEGPPKLLGFAGYKAGMNSIVAIEDRPRSLLYGQEKAIPVTILDCPPLIGVGVNLLESHSNGRRVIGGVLAETLSDSLARVFPLPKDYDFDAARDQIHARIDQACEVRMLTQTQPNLAGFPKKTPEIIEIKIGAKTASDAFKFALTHLGQEIPLNTVFRIGQYIDTIGVSKGKGFQGPVKKWGIRIRHHKSRKATRAVGALGAWHPARTQYTVPRAGQMGYHHRTEFNKRVMLIGDDGEAITPEGGFIRYGLIRGSFLMLKGSIQGPAKRLIRIRQAARPPKFEEKVPQIEYISRRSQQS